LAFFLPVGADTGRTGRKVFMASALPSRPNLEWLKKTARQRLQERRAAQPDARLASVQLELAREFGFSSWRSLKAHIDDLLHVESRDVIGSGEREIAAFLSAVGSGNLYVVRASLARAPWLVNAVGPHPYWAGCPQALHVAIETARRDMFDLLLASDADVNGKNDRYEHTSPLALTFLWRQPEMGQELILRRARIGLVEALLMGDDARVAHILRRGKAALLRFKPNGGSVFAMARTPFAIDRLLALGVPRDMKDRWGTPPLEAFSRLGPKGLPLVRHLQAKGFEVTALEYARMGDRESLERLIAADPAVLTANGVLMEAAGFGHHELVEWLLAQGADVNSKSDSNWSALHSAAWEGDLRMVKILVAAGADLTLRESGHNGTPAACARAAVEATNNPVCGEIAELLERIERGETPRSGSPGGPPAMAQQP
jgi:hypothetical protein